MNPTLLAFILIAATAISTALVCFIFSRAAIVDIHNEYKALLKKRDEELLQANQDRRMLSQRTAELEAELALDRVNEPQKEFFEVPRGRR